MHQPIILPNQPLYNLIPLEETEQVRHFMLRALEVSQDDSLYGRFSGYAYTGCAVTLSLLHGVGFYLRSNIRLVTAILYINTAERDQLFNDVGQDLSAACKCLIFTAAATAYIFASIFSAGYFSFKDPIPAPPPPRPVPIQPVDGPVPFGAHAEADDALAGVLVIHGQQGYQIDPRILAAVAPIIQGRRPSFTDEDWRDVAYNGGMLRVNAADLHLHRLVAGMQGRPLVGLASPTERAMVVHGKTFYYDPAILNVNPGEFVERVLGYFQEQVAQQQEADNISEISEEPGLHMSSSFVMVSEEEILAAAHHAIGLKPMSLSERLGRLFMRQDHITKKMKYREFVKQMRERLAADLNIPAIRNKIDRMKPLDCALQQAAQKLCFALYGPDGEDDLRPVKNERATYQDMVDALCEAWASEEYQNNKAAYPDVVAFFQAAFIARFSLDFGQFYDELVTFASGPIPVRLTLKNLWEIFELKNTLLHRIDPKAGGIAGLDQYGQMASGEIGIDFYPLRGTNIPNRNGILTLSDGREIHMLRHSTPTRQSGSGAPARLALEVAEKLPLFVGNPEDDGFFDGTIISKLDASSDADTFVSGDFLGFIDSAGAKDEMVLHIILEAKTKGQERSRWRARVALENNHFLAVALGFDGNFFNGKGAFKGIKTFEKLRETFITRLLGGKGNYYISEQIAPSAETLKELFTEVQDIFFKGRANINRAKECDEYKAYLLFCYVYLIAHLLQTNKFNYLTGGCKDYFDRGGVFAAIFSVMMLILIEKENDHNSLKAVLNNFWAPPLVGKKKGVIDERAELFKFAHHLMNEMEEGQIQQLREGRFNGWLQDFVFPHVRDQGIYPSGTTATTLKEYSAFIDHLTELRDEELEILGIEPSLLEEFNGRMTEAAINHQVTRDQKHIFFGDDELAVADADTLRQMLQDSGIRDPAAIHKIMSGSHQGLGAYVIAELQKRFNNGNLHIEILQDPASEENLKIYVKVRQEAGQPVASIHMVQIYRLSQQNGEVHQRRIIGTATIADHRKGLGEIRCGVLPEHVAE